MLRVETMKTLIISEISHSENEQSVEFKKMEEEEQFDQPVSLASELKGHEGDFENFRNFSIDNAHLMDQKEHR